MAVKTKSRIRVIKTNILLACLATTDLMVGVIVQPVLITLMITIVREEITTTSCVLQTFTQFIKSVLFQTSLVHLGLISGERYLSMKHPYEFNNGLVTSARLITCSALAWLFSLILHIPTIIDLAVFSIINSAFVGLSFALIALCQISLYREVRPATRKATFNSASYGRGKAEISERQKGFKTNVIKSTLINCVKRSLLQHSWSQLYTVKLHQVQ